MQPLAENPDSMVAKDASRVKDVIPDPKVPETGGPSGAEPPSMARAIEIGGPGGPDPSRYGDWERRGRCIDF